ncbi:DUF2662 domain-containing protein [Egibacter rhizosphaerae]|uniref:DUF2662 domain-containing protein n=1 Tax=Egibacter rhizosphaerae TaxID=1670831 RepID=A0A411YFN3_9ACTN|nr:DUF3662 and FHA domain-containing protein [Egibacter rhizosphaerae]QBI19981.1 DUF2662 domain-containing protein [Egibacter rhizosphaerae]
MGILRDFEQRLEGAVEGFFARAFRSGLQPVELAKAVQRYASNHRQVGVDGVFVPNAYRVQLAPTDLERFSGYGDTLKHELAGVVQRTARERGWQLKGPPRVELVPDEAIRVGTYELRGRVEAPRRQQASAPPPRSQPPSPAPSASAAPGSSAAAATVMLGDSQQATLEISRPDHPPETRTIAGGSVIGRLAECDVTIEDPSVSRRHARIDHDGASWRIQDLGSTNGLSVNGQRIGDGPLQDGDEVKLGSVRLRFRAAAGGGSAR